MSVARLRKLSLVGRQADKEPTLRRLQELGVLHLIALTPPESHPEKAVSREAEDAYKALRFLAVVPEPRRQVRDDAGFDTDRFVAETLALKADYLAAIDRREALRARMALMRPWGNFQFPDPDALGGQHLWFYKLPMKSRASLDSLDLPWTIVHQEPRTLFVVVIAAEEPEPDALPVPRVHLGSKSMAALSEALDQVELEIEDLFAERHARTRFLVLLRARLSEAETAAEMAFALSQIQDDPDLFAVQGWVPEDRLSEIESFAGEAGLALLVEPPQPGETPPTLLNQPEDAAAGVSLAMFYQVPSYRGWDPTLLLVISFAIFFAMILADAGYGFVLLLLTLAVWRRLDGTAQARSWRRLFLILSGSTIAYGALVGSYFGAGPPDALPVLSEVVALDLNDFGTMMGLSIFIGVLHLAIAHFMAFRAHAGRGRWANLAWIAILFGGYAVWISGQTGFLFVVGAGAGLGGLLALVLFSSERPVERPRDWALRLLDGVAKLSGLMGMFGDVLSYMRLFALGLASASLAITFNDLASQVMASRSGLAFLGGLLILLIGHVLNFGLGLMSGVVHGLRLNYIEFYKWGLPEEGTAFRAFARKEVQE